MLNHKIEEDSFFKELCSLASPLELDIVDVIKTSHPDNVHVEVVIQSRKNMETSIDDCEVFHRAIQPFLELSIGRDVLSMSVSTPGLSRNFRDFHEFKIFKERHARFYSTSNSSWISGIIQKVEEEKCGTGFVEFSDVFIEDKNSSLDFLRAPFSDIQKAKLDFCFKDVEKNTEIRKSEEESAKKLSDLKKKTIHKKSSNSKNTKEIENA